MKGTLSHEEKHHGAEVKTRSFALDTEVTPGFPRGRNFYLIPLRLYKMSTPLAL